MVICCEEAAIPFVDILRGVVWGGGAEGGDGLGLAWSESNLLASYCSGKTAL